MSRHRGAKHRRRYEPWAGISLLSPEYLLSVERWPFHSEPPDHYDLLSAPARIVILAVKRAYAIALTTRCPTVFSLTSCSSITLWEETAQPNYPPGTVRVPDSGANVRTSKLQGWYFKDDSTTSYDAVSKSPTYPTHVGSMFSAKL